MYDSTVVKDFIILVIEKIFSFNKEKITMLIYHMSTLIILFAVVYILIVSINEVFGYFLGILMTIIILRNLLNLRKDMITLSYTLIRVGPIEFVGELLYLLIYPGFIQNMINLIKTPGGTVKSLPEITTKITRTIRSVYFKFVNKFNPEENSKLQDVRPINILEPHYIITQNEAYKERAENAIYMLYNDKLIRLIIKTKITIIKGMINFIRRVTDILKDIPSDNDGVDNL